MRKIGKVKYNGTSTADLGVIVSGEAAFDAAAPDYTSYQIPGKNGDLMLSNNRYLNIDVTYPAFIPADFEEKVQAIRSWMRSARSYARIEDNYDLLHYRMGMGKDVLTFEPSAENVGSNMSLVFDCKPQRYLYSGEEENQIGVWGPVQAASGDVVTFEDDENGAFKSISASITPTQDLHGYDYPWPAGGGKNLAALQPRSSYRGMTFTVNDDGSMTIQGTTTQSGGLYINGGSFADNTSPLLPAGDYVCFLDGFPDTVGSNSRLVLNCKDEDNNLVSFGNDTLATGSNPSLPPRTLTATRPFKFALYFYANAGDVWDYTIKLQLEAGTSASSYSPYVNICPIAGQTGASVYRTGRNLFVAGGTPGSSSTSAGITFAYNTDGTITLNGRNNGSNISVSTHMANFRLPPGTYKKPIFRDRVGVYVQRKVSASVWETVSGGSIANTTFVITEDDAKYDLSVRIGVGNGLDFDFDNFVIEPYIYKDGEPLTYEEPNYTRYPVSWQTEAGEVYGGTVDVVSGLLTVDRAYISTTWGALSSETTVGTMIRRMCRLGNNVAISGKASISNIAVFDTRAFNTDYGARWLYDSSNAYFYLPPDTSDSQEITFIYFLATPQTYQLSGQHIKTLLGLNNVWADSGTVTAEWGEDPFGLYNPTLFDALPLIKVKNPQNGCAVTVNGTTMTCSRGHTGTVTIDCELMDVSSGATNLNADWSKDFPKLSPGENSVTFSGADAVTIIPRWWEL